MSEGESELMEVGEGCWWRWWVHPATRMMRCNVLDGDGKKSTAASLKVESLVALALRSSSLSPPSTYTSSQTSFLQPWHQQQNEAKATAKPTNLPDLKRSERSKKSSLTKTHESASSCSYPPLLAAFFTD